MLSIKNLVSVSALAFVCALVGCDQSKAELDATKQTLQTVTADRDGLKTQLASANQQIASLKQQVADLQAKAAAPAPAPEPVAEEPKKEEHGKKAAKKPAKAAEAPAAPAAPAAPGATKGPATEARSGRGHF